MAIRDCTCEYDMQRDVPPEQVLIPGRIIKTDPNCKVHGDAAIEAEAGVEKDR